MNKKVLILSVFLLITALALVSAECCERTNLGAWCQNEDASNCDPAYTSLPTSCDTTAFCKTGTCIDQLEGRCLPNTPKKLCEDNGGFWSDKNPEELPQCLYGCCMYGQESAFVTQTRCSTLGSMFGLNSTYRPDITNEIQCLASAGGAEMGACVIERDGVRNCNMLTKSECNALQGTSGAASITFNEGYLCSAEFLGTVCGPRGGTTCIENGAEVYFKDTCGNLANIYDASRLNDPVYWEQIFTKEESCGYDDQSGNANSPSCGNCEYILGSTCEEYERGVNAKPNYGDYLCADLGCTYEGKKYEHGEKWCESTSTYDASKTASYGTSRTTIGLLPGKQETYARDLDFGVFLAGEESYVMKCYNGEVLKESCSTGNWRNMVCAEEEVNGISYAACSSNYWMDCIEQLTEEDCHDYEMRDCKWVEGYSLVRDSDNKPMARDSSGNIVEATCVQRYSPASDFWNAQGNTAETCSLGTRIEIVEFEFGTMVNRKKLDGNNEGDQKKRLEYCEDNCEALAVHRGHEEWMDTMNEICASLGDCSADKNYLGYDGYHTPDESLIQKFVRKAKNLEGELENVAEQ